MDTSGLTLDVVSSIKRVQTDLRACYFANVGRAGKASDSELARQRTARES
jgi:hypothetical protein